MEEEEVSKQAAAVATLQAEAQRELDRALPALQAAERALDSLTKADITEVKVCPCCAPQRWLKWFSYFLAGVADWRGC